MQEIKKVHVVYKTHLDVGFTDLAENVVNKYIYSFIPKAIELANKVNTVGGDKLFVWTVGSWLIDEYLRRADKNAKENLSNAIKAGYIAWHGLPFTTHSELMDEDLFYYGISISKKLDKQFGRNTIAAKMTDVPGHTRGIVEPLCKSGIKYIHIGVNNASHKPDVYDTFVWRDSKGNEIIVDYSAGYGGAAIVPGLDEVLVFAHSGDNMGPPDEENIYKQIENIQKQFPGAKVEASTLDNFARALLKVKDSLPKVEEEIGDTWIHGIASDPYKVSCFLELLRLKDRWIKKEKLKRDSEIYNEFLRSLLMIPEHTWGLDFKKYLADYKNWRKQDFIKARKLDKLSDDYIPKKYKAFGEFAKSEFSKQIKNMKWEDRTYSYFESSHQEQRSYISKAVDCLPDDLKKEAVEVVHNLKSFPKITHDKLEVAINKRFSAGQYGVIVMDDGSVKLDGGNLEEPIILGKVSYELFGLQTYDNWSKEYMVNLDTTGIWAYPDFFKPGIEDCGAPERNVHYYCKAEKCFKNENELIIEATFGHIECEQFGCPRRVTIKYIFNKNNIEITAYMSQKDASRMPEALWISHFIGVGEIKNIRLKKLGEYIDPSKVILYGNRNYHSVKEVAFDNGNNHIKVTPLDSTLLSLGEMRLYNFSQKQADPKGGMHFNVYNNLWGTNFKMWYEEDIISRFNISILLP